MKIRDPYTKEILVQQDSSDSLQIMDGDNVLYEIRLDKDLRLRLISGSHCKVNGYILDETLRISPIASNAIFIDRSLR